jgi:hypothetical protein
LTPINDNVATGGKFHANREATRKNNIRQRTFGEKYRRLGCPGLLWGVLSSLWRGNLGVSQTARQAIGHHNENPENRGKLRSWRVAVRPRSDSADDALILLRLQDDGILACRVASNSTFPERCFPNGLKLGIDFEATFVPQPSSKAGTR